MTSSDVPNIVIVNACETIESKKLVEHTAAGARAQGAAVFTYNVPKFGWATKINPMTAKFADSFWHFSATAMQAVIQTNMADGVVIVADCDVTVGGLLMGAVKSNCPVTVLPLGVAARQDTLKIAGSITNGKLTSTQGENLLKDAPPLYGQTDEFNSVSSFFILLEAMGLCAEGASLNKKDSGAQLLAAGVTGEKIVTMAKNIASPRKLLTKTAFQDAVTLAAKLGVSVGALGYLRRLVIENDVKIPHELISEVCAKTALAVSTENQKCTFIRDAGGLKAFSNGANEAVAKTSRIVLAKGGACGDGGYIQFNEHTPATFNGKAWVYQTLEEADNALLGGNIPAGSVVVVQNCAGVNVTALSQAILGMGRAKEIAIATDGFCDDVGVLSVTQCCPASHENEEFANIQNGDVLEIDIARGRFNTSISAKDMKTRAKKNTTRKQAVYF